MPWYETQLFLWRPGFVVTHPKVAKDATLGWGTLSTNAPSPGAHPRGRTLGGNAASAGDGRNLQGTIVVGFA